MAGACEGFSGGKAHERCAHDEPGCLGSVPGDGGPEECARGSGRGSGACAAHDAPGDRKPGGSGGKGEPDPSGNALCVKIWQNLRACLKSVRVFRPALILYHA